MLPTPGKRSVNSFKDILVSRKLRQTRRAKIREKITKNLDRPDGLVEGLILTLEDEEDAEIDSEGEGDAGHNPAVACEEEQPGELDNLLNETPSPSSVQVTLEHNEAVYDVVDIF